jgi:hypothetical protein
VFTNPQVPSGARSLNDGPNSRPRSERNSLVYLLVRLVYPRRTALVRPFSAFSKP